MRFMLWYLGFALLFAFYLQAKGHDSFAVSVLGVSLLAWMLGGFFGAISGLWRYGKTAALKAAQTRSGEGRIIDGKAKTQG